MIEERSRLNDPCPRVLGSPLVGIHRGVQGVPSLPTAKFGRDSHRYGRNQRLYKRLYKSRLILRLDSTLLSTKVRKFNWKLRMIIDCRTASSWSILTFIRSINSAEKLVKLCLDWEFATVRVEFVIEGHREASSR